MSKKRLTALGCHIYAGGFSLGVRQHFDVLAHLEEWNFGVETARKNLKIPVHVGKPEMWPVADYAGKVDFLYANPPCAVWSQGAGRMGGLWRTDPRVQHWINVLELLDKIRPKVWACESVRGAYGRGRSLTEPFIIRAARKGYRATHVLVNGLEHGVPQSRPRYFLVLSQVDLPWAATGLKHSMTIADAWRRLPKRVTMPTTKTYFHQILKHSRAGEDLRTTFNRVMDPEKLIVKENGCVQGRPAFSVKRLRTEGQSHVITGGMSFVHPTKHRFLTVEEQQLLCTYPPGFIFYGAISGQYAQIGKAVMPATAEYLARVVAHGLRRNKKPPALSAEEVTILRDQVLRRDVERYSGPVFEMPVVQPKQEEPDMAKKTTSKKNGKGDGKSNGKSKGNGKSKTVALPNIPGETLKAYQKRLDHAPVSTHKGSGYRIREMLVKEMPTDKILATIHKEFPQSKATSSDVSWNRAKLAKQGGAP